MLAAGAAVAQPAPITDKEACAIARDGAAQGDAVMQAVLANCLIMGTVREPQALAHARELGRASMKQGNEIGAYAVYAAFAADPAFGFKTGGKPDMAKYGTLASLPVESRGEQIEALEALGFAASKHYPKAMLSLAAYYYDTVAPGNVERLLRVAAQVKSTGLPLPYVDDFIRQARQVSSFGDTKASVHAFRDAMSPTFFAAGALLSKDGKCEQYKLVHVDSGELTDPAFLPLQSPALHNTYLVKGSWDETWRFEGCGREARVVVHFRADGWGGATFNASIAKP